MVRLLLMQPLHAVAANSRVFGLAHVAAGHTARVVVQRLRVCAATPQCHRSLRRDALPLLHRIASILFTITACGLN